MVSHYSELQGAFGREALYRPKRHRPKDFLSDLASPSLRLHETEYPIADVSTNGLAILQVQPDPSLAPGLEVDASLMMHGRELQHIRARIVRLEQSPRGLRVGLNLTRGYLDLDALRKADARVQFDHQLATGPLARGALVPAEFRAVVSEAVHLVQYYRQCLEPH